MDGPQWRILRSTVLVLMALLAIGLFLTWHGFPWGTRQWLEQIALIILAEVVGFVGMRKFKQRR